MTDSSSPVVLASFPHELEAAALVNELEKQGIRAQSCGEAVAGFRAETPALVSVLVTKGQLEFAKKIAEGFHHKVDVDWSTVDVGDPTDDVVDQPGAPPVARQRFLRWSIMAGFGVYLCYVLWQALAYMPT